MTTDDQYWDDDPTDPRPDPHLAPLSLRITLPRPDEHPDDWREQAEAKAAHELDLLLAAFFAEQVGWWQRRIARERRRPDPHPATEAIARNIAASEEA